MVVGNSECHRKILGEQEIQWSTDGLHSSSRKSTVKESYRLNIKKITRTSDVDYHIYFSQIPTTTKTELLSKLAAHSVSTYGLLIYPRWLLIWIIMQTNSACNQRSCQVSDSTGRWPGWRICLCRVGEGNMLCVVLYVKLLVEIDQDQVTKGPGPWRGK